MDLILNKKGEIFENEVGSLIFVCCICNATNSGLAGVEDHLKTHIPTFIKVENLDVGQSEDEWKSDIKQHSTILVEPLKGLSNLNNPCSRCPNLFPCSGLRDQHVATEHYNSRLPFRCSICKTKYPTEGIYMEHMVSHIHRNHVVCQDCGQVMKATDLSNHISGKDILPDIVTNKQTPKSQTVMKPSVVKPIRSYECEECGILFIKKSRLRYHLFGHLEHKPFKCVHCPKSFCNTTDQKTHIRSHTGERNYGCSICGKKCTTASNLSKHIRFMHKKERNHVCEFKGCGKRFYARSYLIIHMRAHTDERPFNCKVCRKPYFNPTSLRIHFNQFHKRNVKDTKPKISDSVIVVDDKAIETPKPPPPVQKVTVKEPRSYECDKCGRIFTNKCGVKYHLIRHLVHKPFECTHCPKSFCNKHVQQIHIRSHMGERNYVCPTCGKRFTMESGVRKHIRFIHNKERNCVCDVEGCGKRFTTKYDLTKHARTHNGPIICSVCTRSFFYPASLQNHYNRMHKGHVLGMEMQTGDNMLYRSRSYECNECGRIFDDRFKLRNHLFGHMEHKPFKCHVCGHGFTAMGNLKEHVQRHENIKPFKCDLCPKSFCNKNDQTIHIRSHTGEKKYVCSTCGKGFSTSSNLNKHIRYLHNKEKKNVCEFEGCGKRYFARQNLLVHIRTHTGERPYNCKTCGKSFHSPKSMREHIRRLHERK